MRLTTYFLLALVVLVASGTSCSDENKSEDSADEETVDAGDTSPQRDETRDETDDSKTDDSKNDDGIDPPGSQDTQTPSDDEFESCTETSAVATKQHAKTNLIIAVDTSGSMRKETEMVQDNINNRFAKKFGAHPEIDVHIILLSEPLDDPASDDDGMCVAKPLGSGKCPGDSNPDELFWHIPERISSHDSLEKIIECRGDNGDDCEGKRWKDYASPGGFMHFVVVSDDDSNLTADEFEAWAQKLFGDDYMVHGIVAKTDNKGDQVTEECDEYAANEGAVYKELISRTGGVFGDLCLQENNEFDAVFDDITTEVVTHIGMPCEWKIPEPPHGEKLDHSKVNVEFEDGKTSRIGKVDSPSDCAKVEHGWYYDDNDDPTEIHICPQTCDWIQGRPDAEMIIKFGCKTKDAVPV